MPPLPLVPNVLKLLIAGQFHDSPWLNILHVSWTGDTPTTTQLGSYLSANVKPAVDTAYAAEMSADNEVVGFEVTDLTTNTGAVATLDDDTFGVRSGDFAPASACVVGSLTIARRYRGGHPRLYLPWGTAGTYATGSTRDWDADFINDCQAKFTALLAGLAPGPIGDGHTTVANVLNVSYYNAGARRVAALTDIVVGSEIRTRISSQRRRLGRTGG